MLTKLNFHGLAISDFTGEELWSEVDSTIRDGKQIVVHWKSLGSPFLMKKTPGLLEITNDFDIILIDGRGLYLFMKLMGQKLKSELYTSWFTLELLKKAAKNNYSVMILGATEDANRAATSNIRSQYQVKTVYTGINGYFTPDEEDSIVEKINRHAPDILLVGISTPKKELFAHNHRHHLNARIIHLCGGMVDVIAGKTKITPKWIKKLGLAWLYRIAQEPRRLLIPVISMMWEGFKFAFKIIFRRI
ncbi:MAG: WecB/TagA/CpsF family glycosyltransferase [Bacteroidetes bacterium]|nr:WecB/TagA/CpsF family glycosyltransferase [Bacteroidota bacterium]